MKSTCQIWIWIWRDWFRHEELNQRSYAQFEKDSQFDYFSLFYGIQASVW
jgi:hypothetical protein